MLVPRPKVFQLQCRSLRSLFLAVLVVGLALTAMLAVVASPSSASRRLSPAIFLQGSSLLMEEPFGLLSGDDHAEGFKRWVRNAAFEHAEKQRPRQILEKLLRRAVVFCVDVIPRAWLASYENELKEWASNAGTDLSAGGRLTKLEDGIKEAFRGMQAPPPAFRDDEQSGRYFGFVPRFLGRVSPQAEVLSWEGRCWRNVTARLLADVEDRSSETRRSKYMELRISVSGPKEFACVEFLAMLTASHMHFASLPTPIGGSKRYAFRLEHLSTSEQWDIQHLGIRIFQFRNGPSETLLAVLDTALLFTGTLTKGVSSRASTRNIDFLSVFRGMALKPRKDPGGVMLNESEIGSGDFFGILRLDGLDPMLTWGMGSSTGHTAVAAWEDGVLYIAESTVNSSYWPTNGIQRTPYRQWLQQAREAGYSVVHAPLSPKYRAMYDADKANAFFHAHSGLSYGYSNMLYGWIDTPETNYPCLPPYDEANERFCVTWPLIECLAPFVSKFIPQARQLFLPAWSVHVAGNASSGLTFTELYHLAVQKGMEMSMIPAIVEQDDTLYVEDYNNGESTASVSMVCDVFVCMSWKAAGIFKEIGGNFNCVEQTNNDIYFLKVLEAPIQRPPQCVAADPENPLCQLMGDHQLLLPGLGLQDAYPHMQESCPGQPPLYRRPEGC